MFDVLLKELAKRLNLGDRAKGLLGMLLSVIFDEKRGGFAGFIDRFRTTGLTDSVSSWLGNGENKVLSATQLESVLGSTLISQMASRLELSQGSVTTALGQLIPTVIDKLSPDGRLPQGLAIPDSVKPFLAGFGDFSQTAILPEVAAKAAAQHTLDHGPQAASGTSKAWLLLIPVLCAPLFFMHQCRHDPGNPPKVMTIPENEISAPLEPVPTETQARSEAQATPEAPEAEGNASGEASSINGSLESQQGTVQTAPSDASPVASAADAALDALAVSETLSNDAVIAALNLMIVRFDSGTANIKADSLDIIEKAAAVIKRLNPATVISVSGHTDSRGQADRNLSLSQARATAVSAQLQKLGVPASQLKTAGFGDTKPVADNATKEGRAKNRRIEFSLAQ